MTSVAANRHHGLEAFLCSDRYFVERSCKDVMDAIHAAFFQMAEKFFVVLEVEANGWRRDDGDLLATRERREGNKRSISYRLARPGFRRQRCFGFCEIRSSPAPSWRPLGVR